MTQRLRAILAILLMVGLGQPLARAEGFIVSPMSVELGAGFRSATLTLRNDDAVPKSFGIRALAWRHDEQGQELFEETNDLIYFPRLLTLAPNQQALVRIGLRQPAAAMERSWRLFVEELPAADLQASGSRVRVRVRFGVPVFAKPVQSVRQLVVDEPARDGAKLRWTLRNEGTQHELFEQLRVRGMNAQGHELFSQAVSTRYLLAGERREIVLDMPTSSCAQLVALSVQGKTDGGGLDQVRQLALPGCP